jgi:hypothetical protein
MIPIEVINKILLYVGEINNNIIITQYNLLTNKEYYKINFNSDALWKIKSTILTKRIYPIYSCDFSNKDNIELYKYCIPHYEKQLRLNINYIK